METTGGMKEMYDVSIRTLKPIEIGDVKYDINESILTFSTIEIAQLNERKREVAARGGYHNNNLINWEIDKEMDFATTHGVLSPKSWALLSNSKINKKQQKSVQYYEQVKAIEYGDYCYVDLKFIPNCCECRLGAQPNPFNEPMPMGRREELMLKPLPPSKTKWIFVYDAETGKRIRNFKIFENRIFLEESSREVEVDYTFDYCNDVWEIGVGDRLINGFLKMSGKMNFKNEQNGKVSTVVIELPRIRLSSSLSMKLGKNFDSSAVSDFYFTAYPDENGIREKQRIAEISFLSDELSGEYL